MSVLRFAAAKRMVRKLLRSRSYDVVRYDFRFHPLARRIRLIESHNVSVLLDVGANSGQYALEMRDLGYRGRIVSFEPLSAAYSRLVANSTGDPVWQALNLALGDTERDATINISANSYSNSMMPILPEHSRAAPSAGFVGAEKVRMVTLDSVFHSVVGPHDVVFLKVDTQGFERNVLNGSARSLSRIVGVQLESSLVPLYEGETLLADMLDYVQERGFTLMSLEPGFADPRSGQLLQVDAIFFRTETIEAS